MSTSGVGSVTTQTTEAVPGPRSIRDLDSDQFMQIMITELENQDPMNPMDNAQMLNQIGQIREIASNDRLSDTLEAVLTGQSLSTAMTLVGQTVSGLTAKNDEVTGVVERVYIEKGIVKVGIDGKKVSVQQVHEIGADRTEADGTTGDETTGDDSAGDDTPATA